MLTRKVENYEYFYSTHYNFLKKARPQITLDVKEFSKSTLKLYLDYCYGIPGCLDDLSLDEILELMRFLSSGTFNNLRNFLSTDFW